MRILKIHPRDNVLVALDDLPYGMEITVDGTVFMLPKRVPAKHKLAIDALAPGDAIKMYGVRVGKAAEPIVRGGLLTTTNVKHAVRRFGRRQGGLNWKAPDVESWAHRTFQGYHRADGQVGTANHWLILPLVFCENRNVEVLKQAFEKALGYGQSGMYQHLVKTLVQRYQQGASVEELRRLPLPQEDPSEQPPRVFPNIDGVRFLTHQGGCGGTRQDAQVLCGLLAGYLHNPNVAGATVLSLGCQNAQVALLRAELKRRNPGFNKPLLIFEQQQYTSEEDMLTEAIRQTFVALVAANQLERRPAPLNKLTIGMECGGSDGFSGLSANPAMGHVADLLTALGGRIILSEFPELCGVEQELIDRCINDEIAERFRMIMRAYAAQAKAASSGFDMNPSPGNLKEGLLTDAMKSAGAAKKGGTSPVQAVLDYPEYATASGLNLLCTPGNDVESTTGLAGAGASIILFSTGLGTPTGNPVVPVIKISSNSDLAVRMSDLIDFDAGAVITGDQTITETGEALLGRVIQVASGAVVTKAERLCQHDFIPWKRGPSL